MADEDDFDEESGAGERIGGANRSKLMSYSDLTRAGLASFRDYWRLLGDGERVGLIRSLVEFAESSVEVNFHRVFREALGDSNPRVQQMAIEGLWEDEGVDLFGIFLQILRSDDDPDVRAAAAAGLERFTTDAISGDSEEAIDVESLAGTLKSIAVDPAENSLVRRRCIEAIGPLATDIRVERLIRESYADDDQTLAAGALRAMGFSRQPKWIPEIERALGSHDAELRFEAAGAAGLLGEVELVEQLAGLLDDEDSEVRFAAVSALGRIGGSSAIRILRNLHGSDMIEDDELIQDALDEAMLLADPLAN